MPATKSNEFFATRAWFLLWVIGLLQIANTVMGCQAAPSVNAPKLNDMNALEGYWQYAGKRQLAYEDCPPSNLVFAFRIQGESLIMRILQFPTSTAGSSDGYLRFAIRKQGDTLAYRSTLGTWTPFMRQMDGLLVCGNAGEIITFSHIEEDDLDPDEIGLKKERPVFEYED